MTMASKDFLSKVILNQDSRSKTRLSMSCRREGNHASQSLTSITNGESIMMSFYKVSHYRPLRVGKNRKDSLHRLKSSRSDLQREESHCHQISTTNLNNSPRASALNLENKRLNFQKRGMNKIRLKCKNRHSLKLSNQLWPSRLPRSSASTTFSNS